MQNKEIESGWQQFLALCQRNQSPSELNEMFNLMLTFEEKETLSKRVLLVQELLRGELTQREIAQKLNISIAKITRGSNALKSANQRLKDFLAS